MYQNKIFLISTLFLLGCAGPMSPFGAINTDSDQTLEEFEATHKTTNSSHTVVFSPDRQVLHDQSNLDIKINSSDSIGDAHLFKIYYNSRDVTKTYLELSKKGIEVEANKMELEFKNLRLPASKFHKIVIAFQPSPTSSLVLAKYLPPACTKSEKMEIQSTLKFDPPSEYLKHIKHVTSQNGLNPNLLAGLIAQESGFDPRALSWAKAIGLTQVTAAADEEIQKYKPNWPRYNKGKKMSLTKVKALIASGKMNSTNEWRLNPQMSIEGGAVYLNYK